MDETSKTHIVRGLRQIWLRSRERDDILHQIITEIKPLIKLDSMHNF